ncbi:unnamed protein product [Trichogramma brassicae]|uniref:Uncharacterized protein n=1 Tax=Trichogramma brassicae TaxID=86971 RepID=A0A6H5IPY2_9HYME|nr:unnamed protein product [Trichogramma brassicae]
MGNGVSRIFNFPNIDFRTNNEVSNDMSAEKKRLMKLNFPIDDAKTLPSTAEMQSPQVLTGRPNLPLPLKKIPVKYVPLPQETLPDKASASFLCKLIRYITYKPRELMELALRLSSGGAQGSSSRTNNNCRILVRVADREKSLKPREHKQSPSQGTAEHCTRIRAHGILPREDRVRAKSAHYFRIRSRKPKEEKIIADKVLCMQDSSDLACAPMDEKLREPLDAADRSTNEKPTWPSR